jgi:transposase
MMVDRVLSLMSSKFGELYSATGRPSIPPEHLLKALLLQIIFSVRSERQLVEQINYNLLFRWFLGLDAELSAWDASTFSKNRERLEAADIATAFFAAVKALADEHGLLSHEHFTVDGTLLEASASMKSFRRKDAPAPSTPDDEGRNPSVDFHGEKRSNATHASTTEPDARLAKKGKGKESRLAFQASVVMENRNGLIMNADVRPPSGTAERDAAIDMLIDHASAPGGRKTVGADKGYDAQSFVEDARTLGFTPQVAPKAKGSAVDRRTTRHEGFTVSQRKRKLVEQSFGWMKTVGLARKLRHRGTARVASVFVLACAAFNLIRMRTLLGVVYS